VHSEPCDSLVLNASVIYDSIRPLFRWSENHSIKVVALVCESSNIYSKVKNEPAKSKRLEREPTATRSLHVINVANKSTSGVPPRTRIGSFRHGIYVCKIFPIPASWVNPMGDYSPGAWSQGFWMGECMAAVARLEWARTRHATRAS
jgi:hypothetical protein